MLVVIRKLYINVTFLLQNWSKSQKLDKLRQYQQVKYEMKINYDLMVQ